MCSIGIFIAAEFMFHILEAFLQTKPFVSECAGSVSEDGWHNGRGVEDFQTGGGGGVESGGECLSILDASISALS